MDTLLNETRIDGELVYDGHFLQVHRDRIRLPDGKTSHREFIRHPGAVAILPLFADGSVLLERQFRYPNNQVFIEFPAGKIDPGEDHLVCARRELLAMIKRGEITDVKTIIGAFWLEKVLDGSWAPA